MTAPDDTPVPGDDAIEVADRILQMKREFDAAFAAPRLAQASDVEKIVIVEVGSMRLACRVSQISRLEPDRKIVPLSGGAPGLVGVSGIRGKLVPVYALSMLLGAGSAGAPRWLALAGGADLVALAFDRLDRFVRARRADVCALGEGGDAPTHVKELLRIDSASYHVLDIDSVLASIRAQSGDGGRRRPLAPGDG